MKTYLIREYITLTCSLSLLIVIIGGVVFSGIFDRNQYKTSKPILNLYVSSRN